jgi:hypothetical protein
LDIEFKPKKDSDVYGATQELVPHLHTLARGLSNHWLDMQDLHDRFVWRAAAVLSLSTASIILGVYGGARAIFGRTDILNPGTLFLSSATFGLALAIGILLGLIGWLGRSSRAHIVMFEFALFGIAGFALSSFALAREFNIEFDSAPAKTYLLTDFQAKHEIKHTRRGTHHYFYLYTGRSQPEHPSAFKRLEISLSDFKRLETAREAIAYVKPGALGFDWIERIEPSSDGWE